MVTSKKKSEIFSLFKYRRETLTSPFWMFLMFLKIWCVYIFSSDHEGAPKFTIQRKVVLYLQIYFRV